MVDGGIQKEKKNVSGNLNKTEAISISARRFSSSASAKDVSVNTVFQMPERFIRCRTMDPKQPELIVSRFDNGAGLWAFLGNRGGP